MARPSSQADLALLLAGRALYPQTGCAGLSVRKVADHAGVRPGLFHYHFKNKDAFLQSVLQGVYEDAFARLSEAARQPGTPVARLRSVLCLLGRFLREQGPVIGRIVLDVAQGEPAAQAFVRHNMPRHLVLLTGLMDEAERAGEIDPMPPLRRMGLVMGAVVAPLLVGRGLQAMQLGHPLLAEGLETDLLSDEATEVRVSRVLVALGAGKDVA